MTQVAAFDVGSTNFRYVAGTGSGEFLTDVRVARTDDARLPDQIIEGVTELEAELGERVDVISIGTTGEVDRADGVVHFDAVGQDQTFLVPIAPRVREEFGRVVHIENDANVAALGEFHFGSDRSYNCVAHLTFGSGIGAGIVMDGRVLRGETGGAAEMGLIPIRADDPAESYGVRGAWEAFCSGRGIPQFVETLLEDDERDTQLKDLDSIAPEDLFDAVEDGDLVAREYLERIGRYNAAGVGALVNAFDPGIVTLSGSVATQNAKHVLPLIRRNLVNYTLTNPPHVKLSDLHEHIGLYGALALAVHDEAPSGRSDGTLSPT